MRVKDARGHLGTVRGVEGNNLRVAWDEDQAAWREDRSDDDPEELVVWVPAQLVEAV